MTDAVAADLPRPRPATDLLTDAPSPSSRPVLVTRARESTGGRLVARLLDVGADVHAAGTPREPQDDVGSLLFRLPARGRT